MANPEHLEILKRGVEVWNKWRDEHVDVQPDLSYAYLMNANLSDANLSGAYLKSANLLGADLDSTDLMGANLNSSLLSGANLYETDLNGTNLSNAELSAARLDYVTLIGADLSEANLIAAHMRSVKLGGANFTNVQLGNTTFADIDLTEVKGLETVTHYAPSSLGLDTLYKSGGKVPEEFLRGCGVPDDFITFIPSHFGIQQAIQFYSCFISYSSKDEEFARRLYSRMRDEKLRVWFAPEDIKGGEKLHEQIERAIQVHDRLLIVLSDESMRSEWVITEIKRARRTEMRENRRKLFPIRLVDFETIQAWESFDADTGADLAAEVRSYFIPDFSNWKDHDAFEKAFDRLLRDLRAEEGR